MKIKLSLSLLLVGSACYAGIATQVQTSACLGANCILNFTGTINGSGGDFNTASETAAAFFGALHVSASSSFQVTNTYALAEGVVTFIDDITITSPTHANGTAGNLALGYAIDGTNSTTGSGNAFLQVVARDYSLANPSNPQIVVNFVKDYNNSSVNSSFVVPTLFPFVYGTKFEIYLSMQATAGSILDNGMGGFGLNNSTGSGSGVSNFYNTLVVNSLQTQDNANDLVFAADSGTTYTQNGVSLSPEPATLTLAGLTLASLGFASRRRRRSARTLACRVGNHADTSPHQ